jgi:hypothetical protein
MRLSENAHLPFGRLTVLSEVEGLRYPHPSSLRRTSMYASFLWISEALHLDIFRQALRCRFCDSLNGISPPVPLSIFRTVDGVRLIFQGFLAYWSIGVLQGIKVCEL